MCQEKKKEEDWSALRIAWIERISDSKNSQKEQKKIDYNSQ